jgi:N-acetylneuraminate epimerase
MKMSRTLFRFFIYVMLISDGVTAQAVDADHICWSIAATLPDISGAKQIGVAGPFAGISNGVMLIAGGSNFPGAKPWDGGKKMNRDEIYLLRKLPDNKFECSILNQHLTKAIAYGASTSTALGIVCVGGETGKASCSNSAFIMRWNPTTHQVDFSVLPPLPISIVNASATSIANTVYVFGGESNGKAIDQCFKIDLNSQSPVWQGLAGMPLAMSHSAAVTQSNGHHPCIFIIGGRTATAAGVSELHNCTFCYDPVENKWSRRSAISDGKSVTNLSAAAAAAINDHQILVAGGDQGDIFHKIESYNAAITKARGDEQKKILQKEKLQLVTHHPGFSRNVYLYDTASDKWEKAGELPFAAQVTTIAVKWGNEILIPGGEIRPGTRTAHISMGVISR